MKIRERMGRAGSAMGQFSVRTGKAGGRLALRGAKLAALGTAGVTAVVSLLLVLDVALLGDAKGRRGR